MSSYLRGSLLFSVALSLIIVASTITFSTALAQTTHLDELKQNISTREDTIKQLEQEIADFKQRLSNVDSQKKTLQGALQTLDLSRAKLSKDIRLTQMKIERTNDLISELNGSISQKQLKIEKNKTAISDIIIKIDRIDANTLVEALLSNDTISSFLEDVDNMEKLQASIRDNIKSLERLKSELGGTKTSYQSERKKLTGLSAQLSDQKEISDSERKQQSALLLVTKNQESNYKKLLADREARKKQFEQEINDFEAQLRAEIDPNSFPTPGTKVFAYPLDEHFITQKFGKTVDAQRLYVSGTHNGTDFRATPGTIIKSVANGTVTATGDTDKTCPNASYGRWVLIKHRNGLSTLYGHLELIKVRAGQELEQGDTIGYSGNTGYSTGPHLHLTVYVSSAVQVTQLPSKSCRGAIFTIPVAPQNAYLDPLAYL
ncbi:MAG: hypothetical protein A3C14_02135 [Candidatus Lloydbacteria bacterium RIFCSPHIGHO2_02_FULL_50_18]|nr:MAG: hypothetical protein A3C14_02135 [Candidatus Lloydbacteria bacterium RIFCSPHIGHO2_02_FULL_50_18]